jgi:hypothetical protein
MRQELTNGRQSRTQRSAPEPNSLFQNGPWCLSPSRSESGVLSDLMPTRRGRSPVKHGHEGADATAPGWPRLSALPLLREVPAHDAEAVPQCGVEGVGFQAPVGAPRSLRSRRLSDAAAGGRIASCALSDLGVPAGPVGRPELALEELARSGAGQLGGEVHRPRHLVAGQVLAGERGDLPAGQR